MRLSHLLAVAALLLVGRVALAQSRGPTRVDFDERLIKGQTTKAGSVYIFDRKELTLRSLVNVDRNFRARIVRTVFEE